MKEAVGMTLYYLIIHRHEPKKFYGWLAHDPKNKFIIDFVFDKRDDETLEKLFKN